MARERKRHVSKGAAAEAPDISAASALRVDLRATTATAALITRPISPAETARLRERYLHFLRILAREAARLERQNEATGNMSHKDLAAKRKGTRKNR
jgi:hypothetical protein